MTKKTLLLGVISLFTLISCSNSNSTIIDTKTVVKIDSTLQSFVQQGRVAGASALIIEKGKEAYFGAYGDADSEAGKMMDRNTIVQIYSMTKPITGVALMQQFELGKFQLDDPLEKYLPEFADLKVYEGDNENGNPILVSSKRPLTIRDITRHTAGFANDTSHPFLGPLLTKAEPMNRENTLSVFSKKLASLPLAFHPGEEWYYGPSVDVQAYLVEVLSGQPFTEYISEHILEPLGMTNTRYVVPVEEQNRMASSYGKDENGGLIQVPNSQAHSMNTQKWPLTPGGWGLTSTLDDYQNFAQMLLNGGSLNGVKILKSETVKLMATNQLSDEVTERLWLPSKGNVGFGIDFAVRVVPPINENENRGSVGEFFWDGAATTLFWVDPVNELTAVFFVQVFPFDGSLHKDFRDAVYGAYSKE